MGRLDIFHIKQYKARIDKLSSINNLLEKDKKEITDQLIEQIKLNETYQLIRLQQENIEFQNNKLEKENEEIITKNNDLSIQLSQKDIEIQGLKLINNNLEKEKKELITKGNDLSIQLSKKDIEIQDLNLANIKYKDIIGNNYTKIVDVKEIISDLEKTKERIEEKILNQKKEEEEKIRELKVLQEQINRLNSEIIILQEEALMQDFGLYTPMYNFANSSLYKESLTEIRNKQKEMLRNKTAAQCSIIWTVNNSKRAGQKMTNDNIKQILPY